MIIRIESIKKQLNVINAKKQKQKTYVLYM